MYEIDDVVQRPEIVSDLTLVGGIEFLDAAQNKGTAIRRRTRP